MKCNVARWDQFARLALGALLVAWACAGGPPWAFVGLAVAATGAWRFCPSYFLFNTGTLRRSRR